jgi:predicted Zn-dependent peptidase
VKTRRRIVLALALLAAATLLAQAAFKLPAPEKLTLRNGLTVYFQKNADLPLLSFQMWIRGAGSSGEPAELEGAAGLTAALMMKGTAKMDAVAVAEAVDFLGAGLSFSASEEYAAVGAQSLAEHFPKVMEIAADCLRTPAFKDDEFTKERKTRLDSLKAMKDNPGKAVRAYFKKAYFGTHPFGRLASGTETSLGRMTPADVRNFYKKAYHPANAVAAVVGAIDGPRLLEVLNATIGQWTVAGATPKAAAVPALPKPTGRKLVLIDKPDATQAYWVLGAPGYAVGDPVTGPAAVMNTLFGGRFTSWLSTELRIKRGLTYGAGSNFQGWAAGGLFNASSYTKNDKIGEMLQIAFDLLKKARTTGFAPEEVESSRNYILGQFPPTLESNASKAGTYVQLAFYNLGFDYFDKYLARIQAITPAEAKDAAARLIPDADFVLVVVGKAAEIKAQLDKFGTWTVKKITDPDF